MDAGRFNGSDLVRAVGLKQAFWIRSFQFLQMQRAVPWQLMDTGGRAKRE